MKMPVVCWGWIGRNTLIPLITLESGRRCGSSAVQAGWHVEG